MEYSMDWLPSEVCEEFANCDITTVEECTTKKIKPPDQDIVTEQSNMYQNTSETYRGDMYSATPCTNVEQSHGQSEEWGASQAKKYCAEFNTDPSQPIYADPDPAQPRYADPDPAQPRYADPDLAQHRYADPDSSSRDLYDLKKREQKRRPKPKDGTVLICQICGDRALGYNFDAITCESCKAFFRRNALKTKVFTCSFEGNCKLDQHTRKFCSGCRLKKCFDVGMKKDWILNDDQLAKRRKKSSRSDDGSYCSAPEQKPMLTPLTSPMTYLPPHKVDMYSPPASTANENEVNSTSYLSDSTDNSSSISSPPLVISPPQLPIIKQEEEPLVPLTAEMEENIANLEKEYKQVFDSGYSEHQAKRMVEKPHSANDLFNMTDIFIRRLIKFAKHIPEFKALKQEDQIFLLKGGIMEILVLRSAMGFDTSNHGWKVKQAQDMKEHNLDPSIIKEQLGTSMYTEHVKFVKSIHQLTLSNSTIMTLMFVIEIFTPDRPSLKCVEAVTEAQEKFTMWLRLYLYSIMPASEAQTLYPKLLMKLLDVRNLGESSAQLASHLDITKLEPLLIEVFSLQK